MNETSIPSPVITASMRDSDDPISVLFECTVTFFASMTAIRIGKSAGERLGNKVEIIGGLILIAIGIKIVIEHLMAA